MQAHREHGQRLMYLPDAADATGFLGPPHDPVCLQLFRDQVPVLPPEIAVPYLAGKAAATIYARVCALFPRAHEGPTAEKILRVSDEKLRGGLAVRPQVAVVPPGDDGSDVQVLGLPWIWIPIGWHVSTDHGFTAVAATFDLLNWAIASALILFVCYKVAANRPGEDQA